jgi:hypothetical protein
MTKKSQYLSQRHGTIPGTQGASTGQFKLQS